MNNAGLHLRLREHRRDRLREALQPVGHGDQHVLDAAVLQFGHHPQPELGALGLLDPQPEDLLGAVRPHAERDMHRLVPDRAFIAHLDPQGIEEHQRVQRLQRALLPLCHFVEHGVGDGADQVG